MPDAASETGAGPLGFYVAIGVERDQGEAWKDGAEPVRRRDHVKLR